MTRILTENCYILFDTHTDAMALHTLLRAEQIPARISPTPHGPGLRPGCGVALLIDPADQDCAKQCIEKNRAAYAGMIILPNRLNPRRDRFM